MTRVQHVDSSVSLTHTDDQAVADKETFSSRQYLKPSNTSTLLVWSKLINETSDPLDSRFRAYLFPSAARVTRVDSSAKLFDAWREKATTLLEDWHEDSSKDFTDFTERYLLAFLNKTHVRLFIASVNNIVRFNYPVAPESATMIAQALHAVEYDRLDKKSVLAFLQKMRVAGLNAS